MPQRVCFICLTSQGLVTLVTGLIKLVLFPNLQYLKKKIILATSSLEENTPDRKDRVILQGRNLKWSYL